VPKKASNTAISSPPSTDTTVSPKKEIDATHKKGKRSLFSKMKSSNKVTGGTPPTSPGTQAQRFSGLDLSPKSPRRIASSLSPKQKNQLSPKDAASMASSKASRASSKLSFASKASPLKGLAAPPMPSLHPPQQTNTKQSTKKKKSLGKLLAFKKK